MSEQETKIGKLKLVDLQNKTIEQYCEEHCISRGRTKSCYETWEEFFIEQIQSPIFISCYPKFHNLITCYKFQ